jgi:N5-(cytidine 5'-diphosphoramidyl)-L-glutamine hydrolase
MRRLGITQRVDHVAAYGERRDCLDQRWATLAFHLGCVPIPLPNAPPQHVEQLLDNLNLDAVILSGGNSIGKIDPSAFDVSPERDAFESALIGEVSRRALPMLGVCRGMQMLNVSFGGRLSLVEGHVATTHELDIEEEFHDWIATPVNSYHNWAIGPEDLSPEFAPIAFDNDKNIEAFRHKSKKFSGIMWHPEREDPFKGLDLELIKKIIL